MVRLVLALASVAVLARPVWVAAQTPEEAIPEDRDFGSFTLGITGGFSYWTLTALEGTLNARADLLAEDGFELDRANFDITYAYGVEIQSMLSRAWFVRGQFEWSPPAYSDRGSALVGRLGSSGPRPRISVTYETKVRTAPVFVTLGGGRAATYESVRFGFSGNLIIAPVRVEDVLEIVVEGVGTESKVVSKGTGLGFEANVSFDYFTDVRTTLYADVFARVGSTAVELEETWWESTSLPLKRRIDFDGLGLRVGLRWF